MLKREHDTGSLLFIWILLCLPHFPGQEEKDWGKPGERTVERRAFGYAGLLQRLLPAPSLDALCSQGDKRVLFGCSPRIFRLSSGTGTVAVRRVIEPMEAALCGMPWGTVATTVSAVSPVCPRGLLRPHTWLSLGKPRLTSCILRLSFTLQQMAGISWNFSFLVSATLNIYEV